ncbi:uncharacterized protein LOC111812946 [Octodon degus]|uniref:Uncharacterized protein LOC111812946 n=1 Tax=Octodon degus TaxID=10160 RepID=A0A6P6DE95_OCTDE|nr:uncharacterized protein LOC111812946 [Octodon degus]
MNWRDCSESMWTACGHVLRSLSLPQDSAPASLQIHVWAVSLDNRSPGDAPSGHLSASQSPPQPVCAALGWGGPGWSVPAWSFCAPGRGILSVSAGQRRPTPGCAHGHPQRKTVLPGAPDGPIGREGTCSLGLCGPRSPGHPGLCLLVWLPYGGQVQPNFHLRAATAQHPAALLTPPGLSEEQCQGDVLLPWGHPALPVHNHRPPASPTTVVREAPEPSLTALTKTSAAVGHLEGGHIWPTSAGPRATPSFLQWEGTWTHSSMALVGSIGPLLSRSHRSGELPGVVCASQYPGGLDNECCA